MGGERGEGSRMRLFCGERWTAVCNRDGRCGLRHGRAMGSVATCRCDWQRCPARLRPCPATAFRVPSSSRAPSGAPSSPEIYKYSSWLTDEGDQARGERVGTARRQEGRRHGERAPGGCSRRWRGALKAAGRRAHGETRRRCHRRRRRRRRRSEEASRARRGGEDGGGRGQECRRRRPRCLRRRLSPPHPPSRMGSLLEELSDLASSAKEAKEEIVAREGSNPSRGPPHLRAIAARRRGRRPPPAECRLTGVTQSGARALAAPGHTRPGMARLIPPETRDAAISGRG